MVGSDALLPFGRASPGAFRGLGPARRRPAGGGTPAPAFASEPYIGSEDFPMPEKKKLISKKAAAQRLPLFLFARPASNSAGGR